MKGKKRENWKYCQDFFVVSTYIRKAATGQERQHPPDSHRVCRSQGAAGGKEKHSESFGALLFLSTRSSMAGASVCTWNTLQMQSGAWRGSARAAGTHSQSQLSPLLLCLPVAAVGAFPWHDPMDDRSGPFPQLPLTHWQGEGWFAWGLWSQRGQIAKGPWFKTLPSERSCLFMKNFLACYISVLPESSKTSSLMSQGKGLVLLSTPQESREFLIPSLDGHICTEQRDQHIAWLRVQASQRDAQAKGDIGRAPAPASCTKQGQHWNQTKFSGSVSSWSQSLKTSTAFPCVSGSVSSWSQTLKTSTAFPCACI